MLRRVFAVAGFGGCLVTGVLTLTVLPSSETEAATDGPTFVIPANDGYGIASCVDAGSSCGQVVADAWCEAQGFARSASYGPAEPETTGSIAASSRPISVTCAP